MNQTLAPPISRCDDWRSLRDALAGCRGYEALAALPVSTVAAVLAAPAAIALWIAHRMPRLAQRPLLRVMVIGAETVDAVDGGRWYALLPQLVGTNVEVAVTLVGESLDSAFQSAVASHAPHRAAHLARATLAGFVAGVDPAAFDLAVVFHPGMQKNRGWLVDGSLARIVGAGVPLLAASYEEDEFEMDRWVVESHGFAVAGDPLVNPFYLDLGESRAAVRWGRALWQFAPQVPEPGARPDEARLAQLDLLTRMVMHSITLGSTPRFQPGAAVEFVAPGGERRSLVYVFDDDFADLHTRKLLRFSGGVDFLTHGELDAATVAAYPGPPARDIERAMWAARLKSERLTVPAEFATGAGEARARNMLSGLRERAARLFRS